MSQQQARVANPMASGGVHEGRAPGFEHRAADMTEEHRQRSQSQHKRRQCEMTQDIGGSLPVVVLWFGRSHAACGKSPEMGSQQNEDQSESQFRSAQQQS